MQPRRIRVSKRRKRQRGFAIILVVSVLVVLTVLGLSAVMFSTGEIEGATTQRLYNSTRYCADFAAARTIASLGDPDIMLTGIAPVFGKDTMEIPVGNSTVEYTYWVGHYGQKENPTMEIEALAGNETLDAMKGTETNAAAYEDSTQSTPLQFFPVVVTCRAPSGTEVELEMIVQKGIAP